jgi:hypothetical protein
MKTTRALILGSCALLANAASAQEKTPAQNELKDSAWQGSVAQEQLRGDTRRVKAELLALIEEYGRYSSAADDIRKLKEAAANLADLDEKQMLALVEAMRLASRQNGDEAGDTLANTEEAQRKIELQLRGIADQLARERLIAEMKLRMERLALRQAANLRETERLAEKSSDPDNLPREERQALTTAKAEQKALSPELQMVADQLEKAATNEEDKKAFDAVAEKLKAAEAQAAAKRAEQEMRDDLNQAAEAQKLVEEALKEAIATLDAATTPEARLNEAAAKLESQAVRQQALAETDRKSENDQEAAAKIQGELADRADLVQPQNGDVSPEVAEALQKAAEKSEQLAQQDNANPAEQKELAETLKGLSDQMREQAAELAQQNAGQQGQAQATDPQQMQELADKLTEAKEQLEAAKNGDAAKAEAAGEQLAEAQQMTEAAGGALPKEIGENVAKAGEKAGQGKQGLAQAQQHVDAAMQALGQAQAQAQAQANSSKKGQPKPGKIGMGDPGKDPSAASSTALADSDINSSSRRDASVREALSLLEQEKAPAGYEEKVQQYLRTLADGEAPVK